MGGAVCLRSYNPHHTRISTMVRQGMLAVNPIRRRKSSFLGGVVSRVSFFDRKLGNKLIHYVMEIRTDCDPRILEKQELQQPSCLPLSYILRFFTDAARKENLELLKRKQRALSPAVSVRSTTPTGSEFDEDEILTESEDSNDSWTTQEEFSSEFILRYGSRMMGSSNTNDEKPFACPVPGCKKRYKWVNGIKYHAKNGHRKDARVKKAFKCQCGKSYKTSKGLRSHALSHHSSGVTSSPAELLQVSSVTSLNATTSIPSISPAHVTLANNAKLSTTRNSNNLILNGGVMSTLSTAIGLPIPSCVPNSIVTPPSSASPQPMRSNPLQTALINYSPLTPTSPNTPAVTQMKISVAQI